MTMDVPETAAASPAPDHVPGAWPADRLPAAVEAALLASDRPLSLARIAETLGLGGETRKGSPGAAAVRGAIDALNAEYTRSGRSFRVEQVAGGWRVMTLPEYAPVVAAVQASRASGRLSRAAVETLAVIAYRQPITRAEIEAIRGVACGEVLRTLLERRLVVIAGRAEELGRPMLYGTSRQFLETFGLASIKDLPTAGDLRPPASPEPPHDDAPEIIVTDAGASMEARA